MPKAKTDRRARPSRELGFPSGDEVLESWLGRSAPWSHAPPTVAITTLLGEAVVVAGLYGRYWAARKTRRGAVLPGFADLAETSELAPETGREILELVVSAGAAHAEYLAASERAPESPMKRAAVVLAELKAAFEFAFDGPAFATARASLVKLAKQYPRPKSQDDMALALEGFAGLGRQQRTRLQKVTGFDTTLIDEAATLALKLRERSGDNLLTKRHHESSDVQALRNRLLNGLYERLSQIRRAARYLFREHPHIVRQFTSEPNRVRQRRFREATKRGSSREPG